MSPSLTVECAWCGVEIERSETSGGSDRVSHGVCLECLGGLLEVPVTDFHALTSDDVDRLPFGVLELTRMGVVRQYNTAEAELARCKPTEVIGKDFFREVAPCTQATEFEKRWRELLSQGGGDADFEFLFRFRHGHRLVRIRILVSDGGEKNLILVSDLERDSKPGVAESRAQRDPVKA